MTADEWGLQKKKSGVCVSVCERECLCLWIRPHKESSFVSSKCYLCSERHFSFVFTQEASGRKNPKKTQKHFSPSHTQMCANSQRRPKPKHTNTQLSAQTASGVEWGIIMQCVKNKLKISGECSSLSEGTENTVQGKLVGRGGCMVVSGRGTQERWRFILRAATRARETVERRSV